MYAFCPGQPGSVTTAIGDYDQPTADEREAAMGYAVDSTAAPGVTELQRRSVLGECMDGHCMQCLYAITQAWWRASCPHTCAPAADLQQEPCALQQQSSKHSYPTACALYIAAAAQEALQSAEANCTDIWNDTATLHLLPAQYLKAPQQLRRAVSPRDCSITPGSKV